MNDIYQFLLHIFPSLLFPFREKLSASSSLSPKHKFTPSLLPELQPSPQFVPHLQIREEQPISRKPSKKPSKRLLTLESQQIKAENEEKELDLLGLEAVGGTTQLVEGPSGLDGTKGGRSRTSSQQTQKPKVFIRSRL